MEQKMRVLPVRKDGSFCYNIILKPDFKKLGEQVKTLGLEGRKLCIVADEKAGELYGEAVREELLKAAASVDLYTIPSGEEYKTLDTVRQVYTYLIEKHYDRKDMLVALGWWRDGRSDGIYGGDLSAGRRLYPDSNDFVVSGGQQHRR